MHINVAREHPDGFGLVQLPGSSTTRENRLDFFNHYMYLYVLYLLSCFSRSFIYLLPGSRMI